MVLLLLGPAGGWCLPCLGGGGEEEGRPLASWFPGRLGGESSPRSMTLSPVSPSSPALMVLSLMTDCERVWSKAGLRSCSSNTEVVLSLFFGVNGTASGDNLLAG